MFKTHLFQDSSFVMGIRQIPMMDDDLQGLQEFPRYLMHLDSKNPLTKIIRKVILHLSMFFHFSPPPPPPHRRLLPVCVAPVVAPSQASQAAPACAARGWAQTQLVQKPRPLPGPRMDSVHRPESRASSCTHLLPDCHFWSCFQYRKRIGDAGQATIFFN